MAKVRYALDPSDRATNKFLKSMEINIGPQSTETLDTHVQYLITDVELVPYFDMENVTLSSLPHYALNIYHKMEGFENAPGEVTQMLSQTEDKNWVNVRTRYENNQLEKHPIDGMVTYVLSDIEAKKAIDGGAYNDQQGFNTNLKQQLIGQSYTTTDRIKLITRQYVTPNHNMSLLPDSIALSKNAILIPSAMSSSKKFVFDQSQPQNFSQLLDTKLQNMIVVNREAQEEAHKQMVARQAQKSERNHEVKHVVLDNTLDLGEPDYDETNQLDIEQQMTQEHNKDSEFDKQLKALNEEQVKQTAKEVIHDVSKQGADMYIDDDINNFALNEVSSSSVNPKTITISKNTDTTQASPAVSSMSAIPASAEETNLFNESQASPAVNPTNTDGWQPDTNNISPTTSKTRKTASISSNSDSNSTAPKVLTSSKVTSAINDDNEYENSSVSSNPTNDDMMAKLSALAKMAPDESQNDDDAFENLPISQQRQILRQQQQTMMQEEHQNDQTINQLNDETTDDDGWTFENQTADENRLTPKQKRQIKQSQQRQRKLLRQRQQQLDSPMLADQKPMTKNIPTSSVTPKSQPSQVPTNDDDELAF